MEAGEDIFFQWLNFSAPHEKSTFGGPAMSSHVTVDLGVNHGEDSRWITVKKLFFFPRLFVFGKFFSVKDGKKIAKSTKFFSFLPRKLGKMNPFLTSVFFKGVGSTTNQLFISINFMSPKGFTPPPVFQLIPPKVRFFFFDCGNFPPEMGDWFLPRKKPRRLQVGRVGGVPFPGKTGGCCSFISINLRGP